jgi:hypothetical protein
MASTYYARELRLFGTDRPVWLENRPVKKKRTKRFFSMRLPIWMKEKVN